MAITGSTSKNKTYDTAGLKVPVSLGVIMDGNGRWAKKRLLPRSAGHRAGAENLKELCRNCGNYGVKYLTVYAFSTENWSRPQGEVDQLMKLFVEFFDRYDPELAEEGIRVRFTGDIEHLPENIQKVCREGEERSKDRPKMQLIVAFNYGGRREIVHSMQSIAKDIKEGRLQPEDITEDTIS
ncbi:MAG: di-trans,poly-cis-decaprenylcistransferase, partial [Clostridiales bacterium]|nr:di-trans,poly-cis-decaprenylcistransferase [Clostridiales bacterium]